MQKSDEIRLKHMLDAARDALQFGEGRSRTDLDTDRILALAIVKSIEIIGEAASRVGEEVRESSPAIPWRDIVGMRHRLTHAYYEIDLDRVWDTLRADLPPLVAELEGLLSS